MGRPRIGFCCTYLSPTGDEKEQRALNMRQPAVASIAKAERPHAFLEEIILGLAVSDLAWTDVEVEAKVRNLASAGLVRAATTVGAD